MQTYESLKHSVWECKYHVVFIPKYRRKVLYGQLRRDLGPVLRSLAEQKECRVAEGHLMLDHVHMLLSVPPKYSITMAIGFLKGKSAIHIHRELLRTQGTLFGRAFWSRGYCVSTVGLDEAMIRRYIQDQEKHERDQERGLFE